MVLQNVLADELAAEALEGLSLGSQGVDEQAVRAGGDAAAKIVSDLLGIINQAAGDFRLLRSAFKYDCGRALETSRYGYKLAVSDFESEDPTDTEDRRRMEHVLKLAGRAAYQNQQMHPQTQTPSWAWGSSGSNSQAGQQSQQKKKKRSNRSGRGGKNGGSGKAPFYTSQKKQ